MTMNDIGRASLREWDTEIIRLTAFLPSGTLIKPEGWWSELVGSEPDSTTRRARVGETIQTGAAFDGQLTMRAQPMRVDWVFQPATELKEEPTPDTHLTIARFDDLLRTFFVAMERWFNLAPLMSRIAFGCVILLPVSDIREGLRRLIPYLPNVKIDPDGMSDLLYRVNRRRISEGGIKNLVINRLSTWSVVSVEFKRIDLTPGQSVVAPSNPSYSCRADIDVNTIPEYSETFDGKQALTLWNELKRLGTEIIEKGDVP